MEEDEEEEGRERRRVAGEEGSKEVKWMGETEGGGVKGVSCCIMIFKLCICFQLVQRYHDRYEYDVKTFAQKQKSTYTR